MRPGSGGLARRISGWVGVSTAAALVVFAVVAFFAVAWQEAHDDPPGQAATAESDDTPGAVLEEVLFAMAFAAPVGVGLAVGGALWVTRRALEPVDDVISAAEGMTAQHLDRRLPVPPGDDELAQLVTALNQLFDRLEQGSASLARFADDVSHELRTPLSVVASQLEVALRRTRTPGEWEATARTTLDETRRLAKLVSAMLRLARADAAPPAGARPVDLIAIVDSAVSTRQEREGASPTLVIEPAAGPVQVDGDADALLIALSNLLDNALRYAGPAGRVTLSIEKTDDEVRTHVDDTGPGVPREQRDAIFAPHTRGSGALGDGAGLGLAIAKRIAEHHGGRLEVGDAPGAGARFTLALPAPGAPQNRR
jgi:signal transduction histidine kinase